MNIVVTFTIKLSYYHTHCGISGACNNNLPVVISRSTAHACGAKLHHVIKLEVGEYEACVHMARYFIHVLYFDSPSARENIITYTREISLP